MTEQAAGKQIISRTYGLESADAVCAGAGTSHPDTHDVELAAQPFLLAPRGAVAASGCVIKTGVAVRIDTAHRRHHPVGARHQKDIRLVRKMEKAIGNCLLARRDLKADDRSFSRQRHAGLRRKLYMHAIRNVMATTTQSQPFDSGVRECPITQSVTGSFTTRARWNGRHRHVIRGTEMARRGASLWKHPR